LLVKDPVNVTIEVQKYGETRLKQFLTNMFNNILVFFFTGSTAPWALASAFQFHDHFKDCRTSWMSDQLVARPLPKHRTTQTQNKHIHTQQTSMPCVGFEPTIPASERAKTVHILDRSATVTGNNILVE
jgi:hypothetical protein